MKNKILFILTVFVGSFFIWQVSRATNSDIVINEIGAYESSGYEWVEIYNKGGESIDILQWKFWEQDTNHGLSVSTTDSIVDPGEYAVICQDDNKFLEKYPDFLGSVFDSSWSTLNESGEEIGLKDNDGNFVEQFNYITAGDYSLERKNPFLNDYTSDNWQEHVGGNTVGLINSIFSTGTLPSDPPTTTTSTDPGTDPPTTTPSSTPEIDFSFWTNIKINEFACAPQGDENEWVEFYNLSTTSLDLSGGYLCDDRGLSSTSSCKKIFSSTTIESLSWFVFDLDTRSFLNNDKDNVVLRDPLGQEIDKIVYEGALVPKSGQSLVRKTDGQDTDSNADWAITTSITKNSANVITVPVVSSGSGGSYVPPEVPETPQIEESVKIIASSTGNIVLNEIYPDPSGSDSLDEFIEIKNIGEEAVDLRGWSIGDLVKKYVLSGVLNSGEIVVYKREKTGIALNNTTPEEVKLADASGKIVDKISYAKAFEGKSYMRSIDGIWLWTAEITPGFENVFVNVDNLGISVDIKYPKTAEIGEMVIFDASESSDSRGGQLSFLWNFSDNLTLNGEEISRVFTTSGIFVGKLTISSTLGNTVDKSIEIKVDFLENLPQSKVMISEVLPNPEGTDKGEFIELYNMDEIGVDLSGWKLKNKNNKTYTIPEGIKIEPKSFLILYQEVTKLTLTNTEDKITLFDEMDEVIDFVKYEKAPERKSYSFFEGSWFWTTEINPGKLLTKENGTAGQKTVSLVNSKIKNYQIKNLEQIRDSAIGDLVIAEGYVAVLPDIFGSQYFYLIEGNYGVQIYSNKKDWPNIKVGDKIKIRGEISNAMGVKRIKTKTKDDFIILSKENSLSPNKFILDEVEENNFGTLIKITGEITSLKTNYFYLDDGSDEILVYFKKNTGIEKKNYKVGDIVEVTGILETSSKGPQLWPRGKEDIKKVGEIENPEEKEIKSVNTTKERAGNYLTATLGGFSALFFGFFLKNRGTVLKGIISIAAKLIKRG